MLGRLAVCVGLALSSLAVADGSCVARSARPATDPAELGKGKLLVAGRQLADPNFAQTVVLLLGYGRLGALGVIINRPTAVRLSDVLPDSFRVTPQAGVVYSGGPVATTAMLLLFRAERQPDETEHIFADVYLSGSQIVVEDKFARGGLFRMYAGHAGWAPGQLDNEVARGDWHIVPADIDTVFRKPAENMWSELIQRGTGRWVNLQPSLLAELGRG